MKLNLDVEHLQEGFRKADPFPHVVIDNFLSPDDARAVAQSYPSFAEAEEQGLQFSFVNEKRKVQITDPALFPDRTKELADSLASPEFMAQLEKLTGIPNLLWDDTYSGGGMHQTASSGILDVHVDFNILEAGNLFRRLNLLIYLNEDWNTAWGGNLELWDRDVQRCAQVVSPALGRAVIFETSQISFHGVTAVVCPEGTARKSFAVYYYTKEPPADFDGKSHSTIFKARPYEVKKKYIDMPLEKAERSLKDGFKVLKDTAKRALGRD